MSEIIPVLCPMCDQTKEAGHTMDCPLTEWHPPEEVEALRKRVDTLEGESLLDPSDLCKAAGGDWCLEHFGETTPTRDVLLNIIRDMRKQRDDLLNELREAELQLDNIEKRGVPLTPEEMDAARKAEEGSR